MTLSAIIPCHNGADDTRACIDGLLAQTGAAVDEILVVDNGSSDATPELGDHHPTVRVLRQPRNLGFAGGVNRGLAAARGDLLLVINNDTVPAARMLERMLRALGSDSRIGAVSPVSNHIKGPARIDVGGTGRTAEGRHEVEAVLDDCWPGVLEDLDTLAGVCLLLPRPALQRIGTFDERFGAGNFEDDDLCLRLRLCGYRLVVARDAFIHHDGHQTFRAMGVDYRQTLLDRRYQFGLKWRDDPAGAATLALLDGDLDRAARHAERALRVHPDWPDGLWILARHADRRDDHARALPCVESFLARCPAHGEAQALRGLQLLQLGDAERGERALRAALARCYFSEAAAAGVLDRLGRWFLGRGNHDRAIETLRAGLDLTPDDGDLRNALGVALMESGRLDQALDELEHAERDGARYGATNRGICLWRLQRHGDALDVLTRAAAEAPGDPLPRSNLEQALAALDLSAG